MNDTKDINTENRTANINLQKTNIMQETFICMVESNNLNFESLDEEIHNLKEMANAQEENITNAMAKAEDAESKADEADMNFDKLDTRVENIEDKLTQISKLDVSAIAELRISVGSLKHDIDTIKTTLQAIQKAFKEMPVGLPCPY